MKKTKINIGIVGLGRIGKMHVRNICQTLPLFNLKTIADPAPDIDFTQNLEDVDISDNIDSVLADNKIEAVVVCSPTPTHYDIIKKCAARKKHVFCEKPVSFSEDEIKELITIKDRENIFIQVGLNRRFDQDFLMAKKKMDSGALGDIHAIHITNHDASIPPFKFLKSSGGMLFDLCIHDFDMLSFLTGQKVKEIYVNGGVFIDKRLRDIGDVDNVIITLELENGVLCSIDSSRQTHYGYDQRIELFGSKGMVLVENKKDNLYSLSDSNQTQASKINHSFIERYRGSYLNELEHFYSSIISNTSPSVGLENILSAIQVAEAGKRSLKTNRPERVQHD